MATFTALALDRLIESDNTSSMALERNTYDTKHERRFAIANSHVIDDSYTKSGITSIPVDPVRGATVPPNNAKRGAMLPEKSKPARGVGSKTTVKHERGVSLPSIPMAGVDGGFSFNSVLDNGVSFPSKPAQENRIPSFSSKTCRRNDSSAKGDTVAGRNDHWTKISPALYATPEWTPLPDYPSSFPPSPYIINHKRRGPRLMKSYSEENVSTCKQSSDTATSNEKENVAVELEDHSSTVLEAMASATDEICDDKHGSNFNGLPKFSDSDLRQDSELEDLVDPQDSMSVRSINESEACAGAECIPSPDAPVAEFYDAWEELSSESGHQLSPTPCTENELRGMRLSLLAEIDKRKQAEETLNIMKLQWQSIRDKLLSEVGLTLPEAPAPADPRNEPAAAAVDVCQQVFVSRFVSESIGRGFARAEAELEMEAQMRIKNSEMARLCDKLSYYEAVNREMSQRNQEIVETTRRLKQRRKTRRRLIWGSVASAVTVASVFLAYSYFPNGKADSRTETTK